MSEESLKNITIKGVSWSFTDNILNQGITFLVGLVLARLLTPEEYGLIGIITILISIFNSIVDSGFSNALIRKNNISDIDYNTTFITNLILSVLLFVTMYCSAPIVADFFNLPQLVPLTKAMSSIIIINAFAIVQRTIFVKKIDFKTQTKISFIASVISGGVGIIMAFYGLGVWSLVCQQVLRQLLNTVLLWVWAKWFPKIEFSIKSFKELFSFGWKLLVSGLIDTIWSQIYQVIIGKCYSAATLGQYTRAYQFGSIFSSNLTTIVQRVSYPVLSEIQDEKLRMINAYKRIIKVTMLFTFCCMLGLVSIAEPMIVVLIGEQWLPAVPILQILSFQLMLYPLHAINLNILQLQGRSDLFLKLEIIKKIIAVGPLLLGIFINIRWMLWAGVVTGFISYYLNAYYSGKDFEYGILDQLKDIFPSFSVAAVMAFIVYLVTFFELSPFITLCVQIPLAIIIVIILCETFKVQAYHEVKSILVYFFQKYFALCKNSNL